MKKIIAAILALTLVFAMFSCSAPSDNNADITGRNDGSSGLTADQHQLDDLLPKNNKPIYYETSPANSAEVPVDQASPAPAAEAPAAEAPNDLPAQSPATSSDNENEEYKHIDEKPDVQVLKEPVITFSLKVDTASYRNVVRYIDSGSLPPSDAVRIEEMLNYFKYEQSLPQTKDPFSIYTEIGSSPFNSSDLLALVRVKSRDIDRSALPPSNITFLIDTSGSMDSYDKLPLLKSAFALLVDTLTEDDTVSIVTYAGSSSIALNGASGDQKNMIIDTLDSLTAGGTTAGADGINSAYALAEANFIKGGNNRVILATDGDFNVGVSSERELENLISEKRDSGIYLSILGFGTGNLKDSKMETLSKHGNGNYGYIDSVAAAKKLLVDELTANLYTIADDVKAQVEFNPALVKSYRLIGYENRMLENRDFTDDTKDAGEVGIGTDCVLMFEITPQAGDYPVLKYQAYTDEKRSENDTKYADELFEVRIRYKDPGETSSREMCEPAKTSSIKSVTSSDFNFAASVAGYGMLLRNSDFSGGFTYSNALELAKDSIGKDRDGYRKEFVELVKKTQKIR